MNHLLILSLDSPSSREGEMSLPLRPEVGLLKELTATVERAHVVDALAASPLPPKRHRIGKGSVKKKTT